MFATANPSCGGSTEVENTPCGDAGGWAALPVWKTGARLGKARITPLTIASGINKIESGKQEPMK